MRRYHTDMNDTSAIHVLTVQEMAARRGVSERAVQRWIRDGHFPNAYKRGPGRNSQWCIPLTDIVEFEASLMAPRIGLSGR